MSSAWSNNPFNYSHRPYPSGFHAFSKPKTDEQPQPSPDLSSITFGGGWNSQTCDWTLPTPLSGVMEFRGTTTGAQSSGSAQHSKRKNDLNCPIPRKQHITEERMAAHFKSLSISLQDSDDSDEDLPTTSSSYKDTQKSSRLMTTEDIHESIKNGKKFVVSEEVFKFNNTTDSLLPHLLKMEKPCTALIPWKPLLSIEELVSKADDQPQQQPPIDGVLEADEDLGILVDYEEDNNNLDIINLNNNNNLGLPDQNQNDFEMDMD